MIIKISLLRLQFNIFKIYSYFMFTLNHSNIKSAQFFHVKNTAGAGLPVIRVLPAICRRASAG